jgi:hypothetical protein
VVAIIGVVAVAATPFLSSADPYRLDLAAEELAGALRFARSESLRTGEIHGVQISQNTQRIVVYKADLAATPVGMASILYHPVARQPFDYEVDNRPLTDGVRIINTQDPFLYATGRRKNLLFDTYGVPIWIVNATGTKYILKDGTVQLGYHNGTRTIRIASITGRVTVR